VPYLEVVHIEVPAVKYKELRGNGDIEPSGTVRDRVLRARAIQLERYRAEKSLYANAQMLSKLIRKHCAIPTEGEKLLETAIQRLGLSARAHDRILKVARTIADLANRRPASRMISPALDRVRSGV
jgi:magnesium chelatase family protein